jgi:4-amino-4-deoxy-L-arabinose transferase-like glycosyltransferase
MGNSMRPPGDESARLAQIKYPEGHYSQVNLSWGGRWGIGLIVLVLLLAAALRIYHITQQSIWFDEAFAWNIVMQHDMYPRIAADTHPPLYYVLLRGWVTVAGDSALALRYLSAMFSMVTVALVYQVGRAMVRACSVAQGRKRLASVPLLAALVIALSDAEIFLAQESRNYALYTMTASMSMWFYLRWITPPLSPLPNALERGKQTSRMNALGWVLATAALIYTHYHGLFIPAVQGLHVLLFLRGRKTPGSHRPADRQRPALPALVPGRDPATGPARHRQQPALCHPFQLADLPAPA